MKLRPYLILLCVFVFGSFSTAWSYSGGEGTSVNPYQISSVNDLLDLAVTTADYDKCFILTNNIDLSAHSFSHALIAGDSDSGFFFDGVPFTGCFDGNNHIISNLTVNSIKYCGLFGYIESGGSVKDLGVENVDIAGSQWNIGALCGSSFGSVTNCYTSGKVSGYESIGGLCGYNEGFISDCHTNSEISGGNSAGGLCGTNYSGSITNCFAAGTIEASESVGGLCGYNNSGDISSSYVTGDVTGISSFTGGICGYNTGAVSRCYASGAVTGAMEAGGLCGRNIGGSISYCYAFAVTHGNTDIGALCGSNHGNITYCYTSGMAYSQTIVGGICGSNQSTISNCYSFAQVDGSVAGGFCGRNSSVISNCYSTGIVSGDMTGGFCSYNDSGTFTACFWDKQSSGISAAIAIGDMSDGIVGLDTDYMQTQSTYTDAGWDFVEESANGTDDLWRMPYAMPGYPILAWQKDIPGDYNGPYGVDILDFSELADNWLDTYDLPDLQTLTQHWLAQ